MYVYIYIYINLYIYIFRRVQVVVVVIRRRLRRVLVVGGVRAPWMGIINSALKVRKYIGLVVGYIHSYICLCKCHSRSQHTFVNAYIRL
jgi:hypothetical protein